MTYPGAWLDSCEIQERFGSDDRFGRLRALISHVLLPQGVVMSLTLRLNASKIVEPIRQSVIMLTAIGGSMALAVAISQGVEYAFGLVNTVLLP
ncbi:MAG: hypothetical protein HQL78_02215 [Magnetococcales bacterium]|nr:hypothetical protein [Magnetococcales bacterium]